LNDTAKIYGLIFLFQYETKAAAASSSSSTKNEPLSEEQIPESLFFAHQVTTNACAVSNTGSSFKMNISVYHVLFCSIFNPN
jgi:hypothetical protein